MVSNTGVELAVLHTWTLFLAVKAFQHTPGSRTEASHGLDGWICIQGADQGEDPERKQAMVSKTGFGIAVILVLYLLQPCFCFESFAR
jgi:hypothetical protein